MSDEFQTPESYVNPVPEPGTPKAKLGQARDIANTPIPGTSSISAFSFVRLIFGVVAILFVVAGPIRHAAGDLLGIGTPSGSKAPDGIVGMGGGEVTASYTPAGDERVYEGPHLGSEFTGQEWTLRRGDEMISVRDYHFSSSPVADRATREDYYRASEREYVMNIGHDVTPRPITRDGRRGRVWSSQADVGGWIVLAEFPGNPVTVRIRCSATSRESPIASQCNQIIDSLRFKD